MYAVTLCHVPTTEDRRLAKAVTRVPIDPDSPAGSATEPAITIVQVDDLPYVCEFTECTIATIEALHGLLVQLANNIGTCILRARPLVSSGRRLLHSDGADAATLADEPRSWVAIDADSVPEPEGLDFRTQPAECARHVRNLLPVEFGQAACVWRASGSAGFKPGIRLHLWFLLTRPVASGELETWLADVPCDPAVFRPNQPIFTADPIFVGAVTDPMVGGRIGLLGGNAKVHVPALIETTPLPGGEPAGGRAPDADPLKAAALERWEAAHPFERPPAGVRIACPACGSSDGVAVRNDGRWNCHSSKHADVAPEIGTYTGSVHVGHRIEFQERLSAREVIPALKAGGYWLTPKLPSHFVPAAETTPAAHTIAVSHVPPGAVPSIAETPSRLDCKDVPVGVNADLDNAATGTAGTVIPIAPYRAARAFPDQAVSADPDIPNGTKYVRGIATVRALCFRTEAIRAVVAYDERSHRVVLLGPPAWRPNDRSRSYPRTLDDTDGTDLCQYLHEATGYGQASRSDCLACLESLARDRTYDPVRDYLDRLEWPGTVPDAWHLLACVPGELLGVESPEGTSGYVAAAFARWCIAAVQRTYEPGCQFREVITLIGPQAIGKSQFLRSLCADPSWFSDTVAGDASKDSRSALDGKWIIEFAELDKHMREDRTGSFKNFISTQVDSYRRSYGTHDGDYKRRCVFAATSNYPDLFVDSSGNSRFNVLSVRHADIPETVRRRDRIWAAAKALYRAGEPAYLQAGELVTAREIQREHYNENSTEAVIRELWEAPAPTEARRPGLRGDLGFDWHPGQINADGRWNILTTAQIRSHLRTLGYTHNVDKVIRSVCREMGLVPAYSPREITGTPMRSWSRLDFARLRSLL